MKVATNANECNNVQRHFPGQQEEDVVGCPRKRKGCPSQSDGHHSNSNPGTVFPSFVKDFWWNNKWTDI